MDYQNGIIEDIGAAIGTEATMRLIAICGGATLYVPNAASEDHPICKIVGLKPFGRLCEEFGGQTVDLPESVEFSRLRRVRTVAKLLSSGHHLGDIARFLGMSPRQVCNYRAQAEGLALLPMVSKGKPVSNGHEQIKFGEDA